MAEGFCLDISDQDNDLIIEKHPNGGFVVLEASSRMERHGGRRAGAFSCKIDLMRALENSMEERSIDLSE